MDMGQPLPGSTSTLGQFTDEFKDQAKPAAEPKKILEQILGGKPQTAQGMEEKLIEEDPGGGSQDDPQAQSLKQQADYQQKLQAENQKNQALINLHQQRLQEEIQYHEQQKQETQVKEQQVNQKDKVEKQDEVVQLQHEKEKEQVLGSVIAQQQGSKEIKAWGAG